MTEAQESKATLWTGRVLSGLAVMFMLMDAVMKLIKAQQVIDVTVGELGYQEHHILVLGVLGLACTIIYIVPKTALLGAVLLTAYFGGAVATHLRLDNPLFSHMLFPVYLGILTWGGLWLRSKRLRELFPIIKG
jgi:hypothetical protein